jgi:hypothetical protein
MTLTCQKATRPRGWLVRLTRRFCSELPGVRGGLLSVSRPGMAAHVTVEAWPVSRVGYAAWSR